MALSFRICTEADLALADPPFIAAYNFEGSRRDLLYQYWLLQPDGWWLALLDETPVGFGGAVDYGAFSYIGMIAVHPSVQHRGIAARLMQQILAWGDARACPTMFLSAAERAVSLYSRVGFTEEATILQFRQNESVALPRPSSERRLLQRSDIPDVAAFDTPYFGANRVKVLTSYLAEDSGRAFVSHTTAGQITGYIFATFGSLGPWVANTEEVAEQLLIHALTLPFKRNPSVTIPDANIGGQQLLRRYGFNQQRTNRAMRYGAPVPFRRLSKLYGEASPALG